MINRKKIFYFFFLCQRSRKEIQLFIRCKVTSRRIHSLFLPFNRECNFRAHMFEKMIREEICFILQMQKKFPSIQANEIFNFNLINRYCAGSKLQNFPKSKNPRNIKNNWHINWYIKTWNKHSKNRNSISIRSLCIKPSNNIKNIE